MTTQFTAQLPKIVERVQNKRRLTLLQGALLLHKYYDLFADYDRLHVSAKKLEDERDSNAEYATRFAEDWNSLLHMLDRVLGTRVYCKDFDGDTPLWTIEWQGKQSKGHRSVWDAYETAIKDILGEKADASH